MTRHPVTESGPSPSISALSQALRAIREEEIPAEAADEFGMHVGARAVRFGSGLEYSVRVADTLELRRRAWRLTYECYRKKGYAGERDGGLWFGPHDAREETLTLLCERKGRAVATLTLVFDSSWRLPADDLYAPELEALRARGRRVCELVSLVSVEEGLRGAEVVMYLFKLAYLAARKLENATDFVITVNPRHAPYYANALLFAQVGGEVPCPKVGGAPAVLLGLDLVNAEDAYRARYDALPGRRNRFRFFLHEAETLTAWIGERRRSLSAGEIARCFPGGVPVPEFDALSARA